MRNLDWETNTPNREGDWINQRDPKYDSNPPIGDKKDKAGRTIFENFGQGLEKGRDAWVDDSSEDEVRANVARMIDNNNDELERW